MLDIRLMAGALGAEIHGLDLAQELSGDDYQRIRSLLNEHEVIFFRDQEISPAQQKALASAFGPLQTHPAYGTVEGFPEITILESTPEKPTMIEAWHSDMTFREHPPPDASHQHPGQSSYHAQSAPAAQCEAVGTDAIADALSFHLSRVPAQQWTPLHPESEHGQPQ